MNISEFLTVKGDSVILDIPEVIMKNYEKTEDICEECGHKYCTENEENGGDGICCFCAES